MTGCFVTGTGSGVGKTLVSAGLLHALAAHHPRVVGMKPVAAGVVPWGDGWASEDALALRAASTLAVPAALDNPVLLTEPLPPHIAATREGVQIGSISTPLCAATRRWPRRLTRWWWKALAVFTRR